MNAVKQLVREAKALDEDAIEAFECEQAALEVRIERDRVDGESALRRIVELCETRNSGQIRYLAQFLAGLYNGHAYPFNMNNFRRLDAAIFEDCLSVMRMDSRPYQEVHDYLQDGERRFRNIFSKFGVEVQ